MTVSLREWHIDRAYLSSHLVCERNAELELSCRAWPVRQGPLFAKCCPSVAVMPFEPEGVMKQPWRWERPWPVLSIVWYAKG